MVAALRREASTSRSRSWPSDQRLPVPARFGARSPWNFCSGKWPAVAEDASAGALDDQRAAARRVARRARQRFRNGIADDRIALASACAPAAQGRASTDAASTARRYDIADLAKGVHRDRLEPGFRALRLARADLARRIDRAGRRPRPRRTGRPSADRCPTARTHSRARRCCSRRRSASASPAACPRAGSRSRRRRPCLARCAADADFGMPPPKQASPMTWILGTSFEAKVTGSIGHQPVLSAAPAISAMRPAFCGGMTLATCGGVVAEIGDDGVGRGIDRGDPAALRQRDPARSCRDKAPSTPPRTAAAAEKLSLASRIRIFERGFLRLQIMRDQAGALVGRGRAARAGWPAPRSRPCRRPPWLRAAGAAACVCSPAFQACGILAAAASS